MFIPLAHLGKLPASKCISLCYLASPFLSTMYLIRVLFIVFILLFIYSIYLFILFIAFISLYLFYSIYSIYQEIYLFVLYNNRSVKSLFISRQNCQQCLSHLLPSISNLYPLPSEAQSSQFDLLKCSSYLVHYLPSNFNV